MKAMRLWRDPGSSAGRLSYGIDFELKDDGNQRHSQPV
jgi:hypothetical protein